jgi:hypothetical protein
MRSLSPDKPRSGRDAYKPHTKIAFDQAVKDGADPLLS